MNVLFETHVIISLKRMFSKKIFKTYGELGKRKTKNKIRKKKSRNNMIQLNTQFIIEHMDELIKLEDYLPFSLVQWDKHHEREEFLKSKNLLTTMQEMDKLIRQKCEHYENPEKAHDSVLIEWLDLHPEFEGIIANESITDYQNMKANNEFLGFTQLLYFVELPSEKKEWTPPKLDDNYSLRDDSNIQLPNFKKKDEIFDEYGATLLACYLSFLV